MESGKLRAPLKRRRGMTMVELLGVMVVIAIIAGISIGGVLSGQERSRTTAALTAVSAYRDAFTNVCVAQPGVIADREANWVDAATYTSEHGLKKVVAKMNEYLESELMFFWDPTLKVYKSQGFDPWGEPYILTEYPVDPTGMINYFDASGAGSGKMCLSVWCTGNTEVVMTDKVINEDCFGAGLLYTNGLVDAQLHGFEETPFNTWQLKMQ